MGAAHHRPARPGAGPVRTLPQFWFLWNPGHWGDHCTHVGLFEYDGHPGTPTRSSPPTTTATSRASRTRTRRYLRRAAHAIDHLSGHPRKQSAVVTLHDPERGDRAIELDPVLRFPCEGSATAIPSGAGLWKVSWRSGGTRSAPPTWTRSRSTARTSSRWCRPAAATSGIGVLEQYSLGPHAPSGFTDLQRRRAGLTPRPQGRPPTRRDPAGDREVGAPRPGVGAEGPPCPWIGSSGRGTARWSWRWPLRCRRRSARRGTRRPSWRWFGSPWCRRSGRPWNASSPTPSSGCGLVTGSVVSVVAARPRTRRSRRRGPWRWCTRRTPWKLELRCRGLPTAASRRRWSRR